MLITVSQSTFQIQIYLFKKWGVFMENYVPIEGYEGIYEISNYGHVRTSKGKVTYSNLHGERHWKQRVLKLKTDKDGYHRVTLWKNKVPKDFLVHRLVASAFVSNANKLEVVNHLDGDKSNNYFKNLEWTNYKGNLLHAYDHQLNKEAEPVVLVNQKTKETHYFYSKTAASKFLNKNHGFISRLLQENKNFVDGYKVFIPSKLEA